MTIKYEVCKQYDSKKEHVTPSILDAVHYAAASALHTGNSMQVYRTGDSRMLLFSIAPTQYDHRQVSPEGALVMKALAHEIVENIDEVVPKIKLEGFT